MLSVRKWWLHELVSRCVRCLRVYQCINGLKIPVCFMYEPACRLSIALPTCIGLHVHVCVFTRSSKAFVPPCGKVSWQHGLLQQVIEWQCLKQSLWNTATHLKIHVKYTRLLDYIIQVKSLVCAGSTVVYRTLSHRPYPPFLWSLIHCNSNNSCLGIKGRGASRRYL